MLINDFFEGDDKDPCWKGYKQIGMKEKSGKQVPNCVPEGQTTNEVEQRFDEPLTGWHIVYRSSGNPVHGTPSFESKDEAQKFLMTKLFKNHHEFKVVHTAHVGVTESDPSGLLAASKLHNSFIITAALAEGGKKTFRVRAQSERAAREKFSQHYSMAKILSVKEEGVSEGAPELLKAEMPLVRHIEQELAQHGYEKGTEEYNKMFNHSIAFYRKFGNVDLIKKQGMAENKPVAAASDTIAGAKKLWQYVRRKLTDLASDADFEAKRNKLYIDEKLNNLFTTADGQPVKVAFDMGGKIVFDKGILYIPVGMMWKYRGMFTADQFVKNVAQALEAQGVAEASNDYFKRRKDEEDRIAGTKPPAKRTPQQTDYAKRRAQEKKSEQGVAEGYTGRDKKDVEAIKAAIAKLQAQLNHPNADQDAIQQAIAHEKKRLALYGPSVAEGQKKKVQDRKTGEWYNPEEKIEQMYSDPEYVAQMKRMKDEEGHGWPKRKEQGVAEGGAETSWSDDNEKITLQDILELTKHIKQINLPINDNLKSKLIHWDGNPEEIERINQVTVSNQFPILVMLDEQGQINWILDGNHRLHKAIQSQAKTIPAKLIKPSDLNDKAKRIFHIKEQGVAEGLSSRDKKDVEAIKAAIAKLQAQLNHPNADRDAIQQAIAHEKKRLALYGPSVAEGEKKKVQDRKTGQEYDPEEKIEQMYSDPEYVAQMKRMKDEEGHGWPKRKEQGVAEGSDYQEPKLGTVKANLMQTQEPTVQVQVFKHNTLRGDSYWVTKEVKKFKTMDQAQAYVDRINKQGVAEGSSDDTNDYYADLYTDLLSQVRNMSVTDRARIKANVKQDLDSGRIKLPDLKMEIRELDREIRDKKGVAEGSGEAEAYKAHLLKTMPQMMSFLSKKVQGWTPGEEEMLGAIDTAYMVMKHTGDKKQAGKALMDELNTLLSLSQGQRGVAESTSADLKKKISKYEELALAANRAGDDEKCKLYQRKIQALKQKMSQTAERAVEQKQLDEKWSKKYKDSIDCSNPKGFSQRAHCASKKKNESVTEDQATNPTDKITCDVPLLIRLLEYAREDAKTDMDLHNVTERLITLSAEGRTLSMQDYDAIVKQEEAAGNVPEAKSLAKRVRIVRGPHAGKTGHIREIKHGAFKGAPKSYFVDLDDGGQANNLPGTDLRLVKNVKESTLYSGEAHVYEVSFTDGTTATIEDQSDIGVAATIAKNPRYEKYRGKEIVKGGIKYKGISGMGLSGGDHGEAGNKDYQAQQRSIAQAKQVAQAERGFERGNK